jgi:hypothetical protein
VEVGRKVRGGADILATVNKPIAAPTLLTRQPKATAPSAPIPLE